MTSTTENQNALAAIDRGLSVVEPSLWVVSRQRTLKAEAFTMRAGISVAKTTSIAGAVVAGGVGLLFGATGVGIVGGGLGLLAYGAVMVADLLDTGRFAPIPFIRTGVGDKLGQLGDADARERAARVERLRIEQGGATFEADEELYSNLPEELCNEALMLAKHAGLIISLLAQLPTEQRDLAYVQLCAMYGNFGDSLTGLSLARLKDAIEGRIGGNYTVMRPAEIHEYQPPVYQLGNTGDRSFGELPPVQAVGNTTRLTAVDVVSSPVVQSALDVLVNNAAVSRSIYGGQRTGKSYLCAVASRDRAKIKSTKTFFINLNAFDAEDSYYWQHAHRSLMVNIHTMSEAEAEQHIIAAIALVHEFQATTNALLIIDEWSSCGSKTMAHQSLIEQFAAAVACANNAVSPTAIKRKQAIWLLTPSIVATEMIQAAKTIKSLQPMIVAIAPGHEVFYEGERLTFDSILYQQVSLNYPGMIAAAPNSFDDPRMVQLDGRWVPVGVTGHELDAVKNAKVATPAPTTTVQTDDFRSAETKPSAKTPATIPGLSKTLPEAADMVARYLQKNEGQEATMGAIAKVFRSDDREAIRPLLQSICLTLVNESPANYIYKCGADGKAKICYQADPITGKWTGDDK